MNRCHNDSVLVEKTMNALSNTEKAPKSSASMLPKRAPLIKAYSCSDAVQSSNCDFITPKEFVDLVSQKSNTQDLPILDCRSQMDFGSERIRSSHNINCRAKIMARKLTSKRLEDVEPNLSSSLSKSDRVILYDQSTDDRGDEKISALPINLVVQAAQKSNKRVQIIQGGLNAVKTEYPHLIECASERMEEKLDSDLPPPSPEAIDKENVVMTEILPHIFVGNNGDAQNLDRLTEHGITHVLNCTPDLPFFWEKKHNYMRVDILDLPSQNIRKHFDQAIEFIDNALCSPGNVLVHCSAGISRSPTLVLAYMMKKNHWTLEEAFGKMRKLRQIVDPNVSFIVQLKEWEKYILAETATTTDEVTDDNSGTNSSRSASNTYCGSSSKTKTDSKSHKDAVIIVK